MSQPPTKLDRMFRQAMFLLAVAGIGMIGWSYQPWPRCTDRAIAGTLYWAVMNAGALLTLLASLTGIVWTACSPYPRWGYATIICLLFAIALWFGMTPLIH